MVCVRVAFHESDGNHENGEEDSDSYKQVVEFWISGNHLSGMFRCSASLAIPYLKSFAAIPSVSLV